MPNTPSRAAPPPAKKRKKCYLCLRYELSPLSQEGDLVRSADERGRLLSGAPVFKSPLGRHRNLNSQTRMVGRAVRQRDANAPRPFGLRRFDPCTIRHAGVAQWQSRCLPSRRREFDSRCPLHHRHVRLAVKDAGPSNRMARVRIPHVALLCCPFA